MIAVAVLFAAVCLAVTDSGGARASLAAKTVTVKMTGDHKFVDPTSGGATTTISVGDSVQWFADAGAPHTATADDGTFDTGTLNNGDTSKAVTFTKAGNNPYFCGFHGAKGGKGMSGTIVVK